jgi:hypothetical protein
MAVFLGWTWWLCSVSLITRFRLPVQASVSFEQPVRSVDSGGDGHGVRVEYDSGGAIFSARRLLWPDGAAFSSDPGISSWGVPGLIVGLSVFFDAEADRSVESVDVLIGSERLRFSKETIARLKAPSLGGRSAPIGRSAEDADAPSGPSRAEKTTSTVSVLALGEKELAAAGWGGGAFGYANAPSISMLSFLAAAAFVPGVLALFLLRFCASFVVPTWLSFSVRSPRSSGSLLDGVSFLGFSVLLAAFGALEWMHPGFFAQDDNYSQFIPVILDGCRSAFDGRFPDFDPNVLLGMPQASVGTYALTYPPLYLSCAAARVFAGERFVMDVFAILHLAAGYWALVVLARRMGANRWTGMLLGLSFPLSGFILVAGRSWFYMLPLAAWLPILALSAASLRDGRPGFRWFVLTASSIACFGHAGNAQMWAYGLFMWGAASLFFLLGARRDHGSRLRSFALLALALVGGVAGAAPILAVQAWFVSGVPRVVPDGEPLTSGILSIFVPTPFSFAVHGSCMGAVEWPYLGMLYYAGTALALPGFIAMIASVSSVLFGRGGGGGGGGGGEAPSVMESCASFPWPILAAFFLLCGMGDSAPLWPLMKSLPLLEKFQHPFKFLPFAVLCLLLSGVPVLDAFLARFASPRVGLAARLVGMALVLGHGVSARTSFCTFADDGYPSIPASLSYLSPRSGVSSSDPVEERTLPATRPRLFARNYPLSMAHAFPIVYGSASPVGYEPFVEALPESAAARDALFGRGARGGLDPSEERGRRLDAMKAYGVRRIVAFDGFPKPFARMAASRFDPPFDSSDCVFMRRDEESGIDACELPDPDPFAFFIMADGSKVPAEARRSSSGLSVMVPSSMMGRDLVVSILDRRGLSASSDGEPVTKDRDSWGRLSVPSVGGSEVRVFFDAPWRPVAMVSFSVFAASLFAAWFASRRRATPAADAEGTPR